MKKHFQFRASILVVLFFGCNILIKAQNAKSVNHVYMQQGDQFMQIRVDVKNWDNTWNFGKPYADVSVWLYNKTNRKYKVNKLVVALHCSGKNGIILVDFTPYLLAPVDENTLLNNVTKIKYAASWEIAVTSANVFKGFLVEAINIVNQDITLIDEKKSGTAIKGGNTNNGKELINSSNSSTPSQNNINKSSPELIDQYNTSTEDPSLNTPNQELAKAKQEQAIAQNTLMQTSEAVISSLLANGQFNNNKITNKKTFAKFKINGGYIQLPYYENNGQAGSPTNWTDNSNFTTAFIEGALPITLYASKTFYFSVEPSGALGLLSGQGYTYNSYGGIGSLGFGKNVNLFIRGGYYIKSGDYDSENGSYSGGVTGFKSYGSFEHDILRIGGGIKIPLNKYDDPEDSHLELSYYKEKFSALYWYNSNALNSSVKEPSSDANLFKLSLVLGVLFFDGEYSPVYPTAGNLEYKISNSNKTTGSYISLRAGFMFDL